ncbi:MAG: flagellar basal body L-ring protein [Rhodospirillaceae bacterium TMED8]|nr:flagellar basal body L-ring protein [Magnetovibrio sp.]OUT50278.1 MAG: flagellar basal body L-ring protein [Rhodospirillaceae bacterium TMED8]
MRDKLKAKIKHVETSLRYCGFALALASLAGCNMLTRISEVSDGPALSQIQNPMAKKNYQPVSLPMPSPLPTEVNRNSLWRAGARAFFRDHRAKEVGDIVTVKMSLSDSAKFSNKTKRARTDTEDFDLNDLLGFEDELTKVLPQGIDAPGQIVNFASDHDTEGDGAIDRSEVLSLTFAAVVTQILPNGSLVIMGRQEVRVNHELRELLVTGVVRPSDIESDNTVSHEKIAEMRVAYGGRGSLSNLQTPRWGMQIWDIVFPF